MLPQQKFQGKRTPEEGPKIKQETRLQNGPHTIRADTSSFNQEFDSSDDKDVKTNSKHRIASAVMKCDGQSTRKGTKYFDKYKRDRCDELKRRYFDSKEKHEEDPRYDSLHSGNQENPIINKETIHDSRVLTCDLTFPSPRYGDVNASWLKNSKRMSETQEVENRMDMKSGRPNTPPLTLYSKEGISPPTKPSHMPINKTKMVDSDLGDNNFDHIHILNNTNAGDNAKNLSQTDTLGCNTPNSNPNLNSVSDCIPASGSLASASSSRGSMSTATSSLFKQPVLYSAIGSLEHVNCNSLTNLNKRYLAPSKDFCKPGGRKEAAIKSILIAPARLYQNGQPEQFTINSSSCLHTQILRPDFNTVQQKNRCNISSGSHDVESDVDDKKTVRVMENTHRKKNPEDSHLLALTNSSKDKVLTRDLADRYQRVTGGVSADRRKTAMRSGIENTDTNNRDTEKNVRRKSKSNEKLSSLNTDTKDKISNSNRVEMFRPSSDAYTPRIERKKIKYKTAEARPSVQHMSSPMGTLQRPNFRDALRRVAMIIHQHIVKIENRFEQQARGLDKNEIRRKGGTNDGLFHASMRDVFNEELYRTPTYKCNIARIPMARPGMIYGLRKIKVFYTIPSETEIYDFGHQLFKSVQLSSECSIVCLIYVERLMEVAKVPLLACTWRPIFMCGLLLASKVWQDLSSWNIEFSSVYPQFSLDAINKLESNFLRSVKWDLYISSSSYAKYYFALRSLIEKKDFRQRYNRMVGGVGNVAQSEALKVQERTERIKEEALLQLSRSM